MAADRLNGMNESEMTQFALLQDMSNCAILCMRKFKLRGALAVELVRIFTAVCSSFS